MKLNGGNYGLNMQLFGIMISELCRDPKDITTLFRHTDMKDMTAYTPISIKESPNQISPLAAVTSENWNESMVYAIMNKDASSSPLESLFVD